MSVTLKSVLISDPVDEGCARLLEEHGVSVTSKYKLSKNELIEELKVSIKRHFLYFDMLFNLNLNILS